MKEDFYEKKKAFPRFYALKNKVGLYRNSNNGHVKLW
jgi:hypothetical protein